jgi:hypothetical protein
MELRLRSKKPGALRLVRPTNRGNPISSVAVVVPAMHQAALLIVRQCTAMRDAVPLGNAAPVAGCRGVLGDKNGVAAQGGGVCLPSLLDLAEATRRAIKSAAFFSMVAMPLVCI